jgi:hypothetical protein
MMQQRSVRTAIQEMGFSQARYGARLENRATEACSTGEAGEVDSNLLERASAASGKTCKGETAQLL